jgi:hypothetical protein
MFMLIILHAAVALLGLALAGWTALRPSRKRLRGSLVLTALTLYSGSLLVVRSRVSVAAACLSGLTYLAAIAVSLAVGRWRLVSELR